MTEPTPVCPFCYRPFPTLTKTAAVCATCGTIYLTAPSLVAARAAIANALEGRAANLPPHWDRADLVVVSLPSSVYAGWHPAELLDTQQVADIIGRKVGTVRQAIKLGHFANSAVDLSTLRFGWGWLVQRQAIGPYLMRPDRYVVSPAATTARRKGGRPRVRPEK